MRARIIFFQPSIYTAVVLTNMTSLLAIMERVGVVRAGLLATMRQRGTGVVAVVAFGCSVVVGVGRGGQLPTLFGVGAARRRRRGAEGQPFEPHGA